MGSEMCIRDRLDTLTRETASDCADVVELVRSFDERAEDLSQQITDTRQDLPCIVREAVDNRIAELGLGDQHRSNLPPVPLFQPAPMAEGKEDTCWPGDHYTFGPFPGETLMLSTSMLANIFR